MKTKSGFKWYYVAGTILLFLLALINIITVVKVFTLSKRTTFFFNAGVDVLGSFVCLAVFLGFIGAKRTEKEDGSHWLLCLIMLTGISFFLNEAEYLLAGKPDFRLVMVVYHTVTKCIDFFMVYSFYRYVDKTLGFTGKIAKLAYYFITVMLLPFVALVFINISHPIFFTVSAKSELVILPTYWICDLYLAMAATISVFLIACCSAKIGQKIVAYSFIAIPVIHSIATGGAHGYATQYGASLLAVILIYSILFAERNRKLDSTESELKTAKDIQKSMLPSIFPPFPDKKEVDVYASMDPAKAVGGDFYDFFLIDNDHICFEIADVSGKGVPAALFMMASKIVLAGHAKRDNSAAEILETANNAICTHNPEEMFVTVWIGILELSTGKLNCANAGHEYPAIYRAGEKFELFKDPHGLALGVMEDVKYKNYELQLNPGDKIFVYTDGIPEASYKNTPFGSTRMVEALNKCALENPEGVIRSITGSVEEFVKHEEQFDDLTMLCIEYKGKQ